MEYILELRFLNPTESQLAAVNELIKPWGLEAELGDAEWMVDPEDETKGIPDPDYDIPYNVCPLTFSQLCELQAFLDTL